MNARHALFLWVFVFSLFLLTMGCGKKGEEETIDTTPPDTTITSNPPDPSNSPDATFSFTCNETSCTFECDHDGGGYSACTLPKTYTGLTQGSHTFSVRARDAAGNVDPTPASYT